ncbi:right-handed parallel beta-helix repeat-containing protein [Haloferax sp. S1W]|uniref:right-handed parallel beta-helix repeat-containing protein n=1 Tax=Haloferax sp. S1W TaxID=3377110 RepID=UPI0037C7CEA2
MHPSDDANGGRRLAADSDEWPTGLSRRAYLKLAAATGVAVGTSGSFSQANPLSLVHEATTYWSGPEDRRPSSAPVGTWYFATDTNRLFVSTGGRWHWLSLSTPTLETKRLLGIADRIVTTASELEAAVTSLSAGETIVLAPGTYRTSKWLRIDRDNVTIVGAAPQATLVKPAAGANVGGFHVGATRRVNNVRIRGIGFHGNHSTMDDEVKRCHAFLVDDAETVAIEDCYATKTHPYHEHDAGGSGFCVRESASNVSLVGNRTHDIGDRGIQVAGTDVLVARNQFTDGFDRCISLEVRQPDGRKRFAESVTVVNNVGRGTSNGSVVGASQGPTDKPGPGNVAIIGNVAAGTHRRTVYLGVEARMENVAIVGNVGRQADFDERRSGIYVAGHVSNLTVTGNTLSDYSLHGIELVGSGSGVVCANNTVSRPSRTGVVVAIEDAVVTGNRISKPGRDGIVVDSTDVTLLGNAVSAPGGIGIHVTESASRVSAIGNRTRGASQAVRLDGTECVVAGSVAPDGTLSEGPDADRNTLFGNLLQSQTVRGQQTTVVDGGERHTVTVDDGDAVVALERRYQRKPTLDVYCDDPILWSADWLRDDGDYVGVALSVVDSNETPVSTVATVRVHT